MFNLDFGRKPVSIVRRRELKLQINIEKLNPKMLKSKKKNPSEDFSRTMDGRTISMNQNLNSILKIRKMNTHWICTYPSKMRVVSTNFVLMKKFTFHRFIDIWTRL